MGFILFLFVIVICVLIYYGYKTKKEEDEWARSERRRIASEDPVKLIYDNTKLKPWCVEKFDGERYVQVTGWFAKEENAREVYNRLVRETTKTGSDGSIHISSTQLSTINKKNATVNYVDQKDRVLISDKYDSQGKIAKKTNYNDNGSIAFTDEFDSNTGKKIRHTSYENGKIFLIEVFDPASGNQRKTTYYEPDGSISLVKEFDRATGNQKKPPVTNQMEAYH